MRALFLFNHDAGHQVAHLAGIAAATARNHQDIETVIAYATPSIRARLDNLISTADTDLIHWERLDLPPLINVIVRLLDKVLPASRLMRLRSHTALFADADMIISTERTCLSIKKRLGDQAPLFACVPHGTGDRSVSFHPDYRRFDLNLVAGQKLARQLADHGVDPARIRVTGYSKFEGIDLTAKPDFFANGRPTFVYNPHFDPYLSSWYDSGPDLLRWFASDEGQAFNLIFAPHVMLFRKRLHISPEYKVARIRPDIPAEALAAKNILADVNSPRLFDMSYMLGSDGYIGDASSQIYEFLMRPRPVFLFDPNCALGKQGESELPFLKTGPRSENLNMLVQSLQEHHNVAAAYRETQERLIEDTFTRYDIPPSQKAAQIIADTIRERRT